MRRWLSTIRVVGLVLLCVLACVPGAWSQPIAEPVLTSDLQMQARGATVVTQGDTKLIQLDGDVSVSIGAYAFRSRSAVVRITSKPGPGETVRSIALYFEDAESGGAGGVQADGAGLLVTVATSGRVLLTAVKGRAEVLPDSPLSRAAVARFREYDRRIAQPMLDVPPDSGLTEAQLRLRERRRAQIEGERRRIELPEPGEVLVDDELVDQPVLPVRGTIRYASVDRIVREVLEDEEAIILIGGVTVMYEDADEDRDVILTAERIVVFLDKDDAAAAPTAQVDAGRVRGIYLEDAAVISDGSTTVRAPRAFYDLQADRAILLDAVVYRYDLRTRVPLYLRADVIRQTSAQSFSADDATFTTSEFGKPHLSIGASKITLLQSETEDGEPTSLVTAEDITIKGGDTPFFYWPKAKVKDGSIPLRRIRAAFDGQDGATIQTTWDLFALTGTEAPQGVELLGQVDYRGEHGPAVGLDLQYNRDDSIGSFYGYFLPFDSGEDEIAERRDVSFDDETRGFFRFQHVQALPAGWELWLEANHVSDPTFLEEFNEFENLAYAGREFENSIYVKKAEDDWSLSGLIKGELNNFTPQYAPLLTPGYTVEKLPEAEYRVITSILDDWATLYHESRVGQMRAVFGDDSPGDRGFTAAQSAAAFGIAPGTSFNQAAIAAGFPRSVVGRLDSRTEITAPLRAGRLDVTPFLVGRVTAYDDDFATFNGGNNDQARFWGGFGVNASTQFSKVNNNISSTLFDVQGIRHIIEPGVTLALYDGTMNSTDLPIYDPEVERLTEGGVARLGVVNTWQTRRGGPGRSRSVDWIKLRTDVVLASENAANPTSLPRYYDYRPEYTLGDDHFYAELLWAVTEATALTGEVTHNFDQGSVVQWRVGVENTHTDRLSSFINYREIDVLRAQLLSYGANLKLTPKYRVGVFQVIDFGEGESQTINFTIDRRVPQATLGLVVGYDAIDGEASVSVVLTPQGFNQGLTSGGFFGPRR